jgi:hypothetical protein
MHFIKICLGRQIRGLVDAERVVGMVKPVELRQLERPRRRYEIILKLIFSDYGARL